MGKRIEYFCDRCKGLIDGDDEPISAYRPVERDGALVPSPIDLCAGCYTIFRVFVDSFVKNLSEFFDVEPDSDQKELPDEPDDYDDEKQEEHA